MIKKLVTISLIIFAGLLVLILIVGLLAKSGDGRYGWQKLLDDRQALFNSFGLIGQGQPASSGNGPISQTDPNVDSSASSEPVSSGDNASQPAGSNAASPSQSPSSSAAGSIKPTATGGSSSSGGSTKPSPSPTPSPAPAPPPTPPPTPTCTAGGACTAAQVATHNSAGNCWVIYGNKVYNITAFVNNHPAGPSYFTAQTCGHDITAFLNGSQTTTGGRKHNHSSSAYSILNSYWYANLN